MANQHNKVSRGHFGRLGALSQKLSVLFQKLSILLHGIVKPTRFSDTKKEKVPISQRNRHFCNSV
jgi:hypothetical protein